MKFTPALSREFRPYKPDPAPLLHICSTWGLPPNEVMMIGDSLKDDVSIISYLFETKPEKDGWRFDRFFLFLFGEVKLFNILL